MGARRGVDCPGHVFRFVVLPARRDFGCRRRALSRSQRAIAQVGQVGQVSPPFVRALGILGQTVSFLVIYLGGAGPVRFHGLS